MNADETNRGPNDGTDVDANVDPHGSDANGSEGHRSKANRGDANVGNADPGDVHGRDADGGDVDRPDPDDRDIDIPEVRAEVEALFARYEEALTGNDTATLDALFWTSPRTVRYGATENLYGIDAIREFRRARSSVGLERVVRRTAITTFGRDTATTAIEFVRAGSTLVGRQMQTWVRRPEGFRIVAAHVSVVDLGPGT